MILAISSQTLATMGAGGAFLGGGRGGIMALPPQYAYILRTNIVIPTKLGKDTTLLIINKFQEKNNPKSCHVTK